MRERLATEHRHFAVIRDHLAHAEDVRDVRDVRDDPTYRSMDVDLVVVFSDGHRWLVEVKVEPKADLTGNFAFETVSNDLRGTPGCFMYTAADHVVSYLPHARRLYYMPMPKTREWFIANERSFPEFKTATRSGDTVLYRTIFRAVPIERVLEEVEGAYWHDL